jgi:hypothetical protein
MILAWHFTIDSRQYRRYHRPMLVNTDDLLTVTNAARVRGITRQSLHGLIDRGRITPVVIDGVLFVRQQDARPT